MSSTGADLSMIEKNEYQPRFRLKIIIKSKAKDTVAPAPGIR
jgi:hypothetical protein